MDAVCKLREPDRYLRGLVHWLGFRQDHFRYDRAKRKGGNSSANLIYCVRFALHAIICFSSKPMHLSMLIGCLLTLGSLFLGIVYTVFYFVRPAFMIAPPPGLTTVTLLVLFVLGVNALLLGIMGEYVGRIYNQGKKRPLYIVADKVNL